MLQADHNRNKYESPVLSRKKLGKNAAPVRAINSVRQPSGAIEPPDLGDANAMSLEEFAATYGDLRDELAFRFLSGETLSPRETVTLEMLNQLLEQLVPKPKALPKPVMKLVHEILRRK
jgi:hypothetical protein